jgi:hypothetical protein
MGGRRGTVSASKYCPLHPFKSNQLPHNRDFL